MTTAEPDPEAFRAQAIEFIAKSRADGTACPAFGLIVPPDLVDRARSWQRRLFDAGYAGLHWACRYGGRGYDRAHTAIWAEECARAEVQPFLNVQGIVLAGEAILRSGTEDQKVRFLRDTLAGEIMWCQLFSEPDAGSDLASLRTSAVRDGDHFSVNGLKVWCSNGEHADRGILLARTGEPGHRGISFFLLDMRAPGVTVRPLRQMTGDREFSEVVLEDVELPADAMLGHLNDGWRIAMDVLGDERTSSGSSGLIGLGRRLEQMASLGSDDPVLTDHIRRLLVRGRVLETLMRRSGSDPATASMAKLLRTELEFDAVLLQAARRGADAMLDGPETRRFLYAPGSRIAGGSSEIQRNIIGERLLGLPREPRPD